MKNKKAVAMGFVVILILVLVSAGMSFQVLNKSKDIFDKFSSGGALCLATLKAQALTSETHSVMGMEYTIGLFKQKCTTMESTLDIKRLNVKSPRAEQDRQDALLKQIADRMALVWWMTGAGTMEELWIDNGLFQNYLAPLYMDEKKLGCITLMNFKIEDSKYLPEKSLIVSDLMDYLASNDYVVKKDGKNVIMTYKEYLTMFGGVDTGKILAFGTTYVPGKIYSISLVQPIKREEYPMPKFFAQLIFGYGGAYMLASTVSEEEFLISSSNFLDVLGEEVRYKAISQDALDNQNSMILIAPRDISQNLIHCKDITTGE